MRLAGTLTVVLLLLPVSANALGDEGHRLVCEIAWQDLTPIARSLVENLQRLDTFDTFAESCVWADVVRNTTREETRTYHFINIPSGRQEVDVDEYCEAPRRCAPWAIRHYGLILEDTSNDDAERLEALKFLAHFVGDLHQPLHAGRPADLGGNNIDVRFFGETRSLHSIWDTWIISRAGLHWRTDGPRLYDQISPSERARWQGVDVAGWTLESYRLDEDYVYSVRDGGSITQEYYRNSLRDTVLQIKKAGVRLAFLINQAAEGDLAFN